MNTEHPTEKPPVIVVDEPELRVVETEYGRVVYNPETVIRVFIDDD